MSGERIEIKRPTTKGRDERERRTGETTGERRFPFAVDP